MKRGRKFKKQELKFLKKNNLNAISFALIVIFSITLCATYLVTVGVAGDFWEGYFVNTHAEEGGSVNITGTNLTGTYIGQIDIERVVDFNYMNWSGNFNNIEPIGTDNVNVTMNVRAKSNLFCNYMDCTGLVSWWGFDGTASDFIGNNSGNITGAFLTEGRVSDALIFDSTNHSSVNMTSSNSLCLGVNHSITMWIKLTAIPKFSFNQLLYKSPDSLSSLTTADYSIYFSLSKSLVYRVGNETGSAWGINLDTGTVSLNPIGNWTFVAFTYNGSMVNIYVNGSIFSFTDGVHMVPRCTAGANLMIGQRLGGAYTLNATLDEFQIWNRTLSSGEISALHNNTATYNPNWTDWSAESSNNNSFDISAYTTARYLQYQANFKTDNAANQPTLDNIEISYSDPVDIAAPTSTLVSHVDYWNQSAENVSFSCSATDLIALQNITLYTNWTDWHANKTIDVSGVSGSASFSKEFPEGSYLWNCYACDTSNNCAFASANRTFTVDTTPPNITVYSPLNGTSFNVSTGLLVNFSADDSLLNVSSQWYYNGSENITYNTFSTIILPEGTHTFTFYANDSVGNVNSTNITFEGLNYTYISTCADINAQGNYYLLDDISDSSQNNCINISVSNVSFDGGGHIIDGNGTSLHGVRTYSGVAVHNVTVKNFTVTKWDEGGVYIFSSNEIHLQNINATNNSGAGIFLYQADNNTLNGIIADSNDVYGVEIRYSDNNSLNNITALRTKTGVFFAPGLMFEFSEGNVLNNSVLRDNEAYDFHIVGDSPKQCNQIIENVTISGNQPLYYYNHSVEISNIEMQELVLCNADHSNLTNVTIKNFTSIRNNGFVVELGDYCNFTDLTSSYTLRTIFLYRSENNTIRNITGNYNKYGLWIENSNNNIIRNSVSNNNTLYGINFEAASNNNTIINAVVNLNGNGIHLSGANNTLDNVTASFNRNNGIIAVATLKGGSIIKNSIIQNNSAYGLQIAEANCSIYNNFINNSVNINFYGTLYNNSWNTTKQAGDNIYNPSNPFIGGNFWATPAGTGYSQTCTDTYSSGFCDTPYDVKNDTTGCTSGNCDYLPLSMFYTVNTIPSLPVVTLTSIDNRNSSSSDLTCSAVISDADGDKLNVTLRWYNNSMLDSETEYPDSYASGSTFSSLLAFGNLTIGHNWTCSVRSFDRRDYSSWVNSSNLEIINACSENWFCTDWGYCNGGIQTRTCTDSNDCGTEEDKPATSQTCYVPGGSSGGTTTAPPASTPAEITPPPTFPPAKQTEPVPQIPVEQPVNIEIQNPNIEVTNIEITALEAVEGEEVSVENLDTTPATEEVIVGLCLGGGLGEVYTAFSIKLKKLEDNKIRNATIGFKVNKTWYSQNNGTLDDLKLFRQNSKTNEWDVLTTYFRGEDDLYVYFEAKTPGFSNFAVLFAKCDCAPNARRCFNNFDVQVCVGNATWLRTEVCGLGCNRGACISEIPPQSLEGIVQGIVENKTNLAIVVGGISAVILLIIMEIIRRRIKKKHGKKKIKSRKIRIRHHKR